ncbi:MAG: hypothetical protein V2A76_04545 [Planctomycetota bacterium]
MTQSPRIAGLFLFLSVLLLCSGCSYMEKRGNDALDMVDLGITVNDQLAPEFGFYFDFFDIIPLGYSNFTGKTLGIGNRQIGYLDAAHNSWGVIGWGSELKGYGRFNPKDPRQARPDQANLTERPYFHAGIPRLIIEEDGCPPIRHHVECDRFVHLGWIGIQNTMRPLEILDFLAGWTTLDFMNDDDIPDPVPPEADAP